MTGAASVGARESSLTVGYEAGSGYLVGGFLDEALFGLELETRLLFELEAGLRCLRLGFCSSYTAWLVSEFEVRPALELEDRLPLELEVRPAFQVEDRRVEDACVEDLAVLENLAGSVIPLSLAHFSGSTPLEQHHPLTRQKVPDSHAEPVNCHSLNLGSMELTITSLRITAYLPSFAIIAKITALAQSI